MAGGRHMAHADRQDSQVQGAPQEGIAKRGWVKMAVSVVASIVATVAAAGLLFAGLLPFPDNPILGASVGRIAAGLVVTIIFVLLGGRSWLKITGSGLAYTFKRAWMLLLIGAVPGGFTIFQTAMRGGIPEDFLPNLALVVLLCIGIGLLEECIFRGIELNGLLAGLSGWRLGVLASVVLSSILFGWTHIGAGNVTDATSAVQAALKIMQSTMFGIVLCETCMHARELGSAVLFHALNDFLMMSVTMGLQGNTAASSYTNTDLSTAVYVVYGIMIAVSLWPTIQALRRLWSEHQVDHGAFME